MIIKFKIRKTKYVLTSDSRQFILSEDKGKNKDGEQKVQNTVYFPNLEQVLEHLYQAGLRDNTVDSFRELVKHSYSIRDEVLRVGKLFTLTGE